MKAAEKGHERVAEVLIDLNADLNLQNSVSTGERLLHLCYLIM